MSNLSPSGAWAAPTSHDGFVQSGIPIEAEVALSNILIVDHDVRPTCECRGPEQMSNGPNMRRTDRLMPDEETLKSLQ